jgi:hypothetical protein
VLGHDADLSLTAALVGQDASHAVGLPAIDVPTDIVSHDVPLVDVHVQPDHA